MEAVVKVVFRSLLVERPPRAYQVNIGLTPNVAILNPPTRRGRDALAAGCPVRKMHFCAISPRDVCEVVEVQRSTRYTSTRSPRKLRLLSCTGNQTWGADDLHADLLDHFPLKSELRGLSSLHAAARQVPSANIGMLDEENAPVSVEDQTSDAQSDRVQGPCSPTKDN